MNFLLVLLLSSCSFAFAFSLLGLGPAPNDLALLSSITDDNGIHATVLPNFELAIKWINEARATTSTCTKLATAALVNSCASIEQEDANVILNQVKNTYAAQLALCELADARLQYPAKCGPVYPRSSSRGRVHHSLSIHINDVTNCLSALEQTPQHWTSYSNARQNAVQICKSSRQPIELREFEEGLAAYKAMTQASAEASGDLASNLAAYQAFQSEVRELNREMVRELRKQGTTVSRFSTTISDTLDKASSKLHMITSKTATEITQQLQQVKGQISSFYDDLRLTQDSHKKVTLLITKDLELAHAAREAENQQIEHHTAQIKQLVTYVQSMTEAFHGLLTMQGDLAASIDRLALTSNSTERNMQLVNRQVKSFNTTVDSIAGHMERIQNASHIWTWMSRFFDGFAVSAFAFGLAVPLGFAIWLCSFLLPHLRSTKQAVSTTREEANHLTEAATLRQI